MKDRHRIKKLEMNTIDLPIGYFAFHRNRFINYQLNRWHSLGQASKNDLVRIGNKIRTFEDYIDEFLLASEKAKNEDRLLYAAAYLRAAEFLVSPKDVKKQQLYNDYIALFDAAMINKSHERHQIPYGKDHLSALRFPCKLPFSKGTIVAIPGFDAFIEEFYGIWENLSASGYEVIAFEGPGQGGTLRKYGLSFDHDYENPTKAVLDYFGLRDVTALGLSMGGYWIMRAAAFESRIKRVVAMPPVYDWLEMTNSVNRWTARWLLRHRKIANLLVRLKMHNYVIKHAVSHALFIQKKEDPHDAIAWMLAMNKSHISSNLIIQDVLLLGGEHDAFQPSILLEKQEKALTNARSITKRTFRKSEHADQHCQIGNLPLAMDTIIAWLEAKKK